MAGIVPKFTVESARLAGLKSVAVRKQRDLERENLPLPDALPDDEDTKTFTRTLGVACTETLVRLRKTSKAIERAQLARALRDLRETWHLATGKPRPGLSRPELAPKQRREMPRVYPAVYPPKPNGESPNQ